MTLAVSIPILLLKIERQKGGESEGCGEPKRKGAKGISGFKPIFKVSTGSCSSQAARPRIKSPGSPEQCHWRNPQLLTDHSPWTEHSVSLPSTFLFSVFLKKKKKNPLDTNLGNTPFTLGWVQIRQERNYPKEQRFSLDRSLSLSLSPPLILLSAFPFAM